ncbi:GL12512 [Drosophila persimilis]|uniref:GL12512 n=1 Tax=Drosophila persimilis TaxID=7234 RepID=B4GL67_DROPE|nr:GL12512 [Drosophila persimilis]
MSKLTFADYLTLALKTLEPPCDWEDIVEFVLITLDCTWRQKYFAKQLKQALDVGLRFGIIREMNNKYYLYEYAKVNACGHITYKFTQNPLSPEYRQMKEQEEQKKVVKVKSPKKKQVKSTHKKRKATKKKCRK